MQPEDFRNATFESLQERLTGMRAQVLAAWRRHGPGTTREISQRSGIDILGVRPRTTELFDLGFIALTGSQGTEGVYRARSFDEVRAWLAEKQRAALAIPPPQAEIPGLGSTRRVYA